MRLISLSKLRNLHFPLLRSNRAKVASRKSASESVRAQSPLRVSDVESKAKYPTLVSGPLS